MRPWAESWTATFAEAPLSFRKRLTAAFRAPARVASVKRDVVVEDDPELKDPEQDRHQDRQDERELDDCLAALVPAPWKEPHGQLPNAAVEKSVNSFSVAEANVGTTTMTTAMIQRENERVLGHRLSGVVVQGLMRNG